MSKMQSRFEVVSTLALTGAALTMMLFYFYDRTRATAQQPLREPVRVANWKTENENGILIGKPDAKVVITEFVDFECPACAMLVPRLDSLKADYGDDLALVLIHFPLTTHGYARPAAVAAECAHRQDRFAAFSRTLLLDQRAMGNKPWREFAQTAGIPDLDAFERCSQLPTDSFPRIDAGRAAGERNSVTGTPTVWVNGLQIIRKDLAALRAWSEEELKGQSRR